MTDNYKLQVSFKTASGSMINLRADDEPELSEHLDVLGRQLKGIGEIEEALGAMKNIYDGMSPVERLESKPAPAAAAPQAAQPAAPTSDAPQCRHGAMEYKAGVSKAGKPYKMWACGSGNRSDQCDPQWIR